MDSFHARAVDSLLQDPACDDSEDLVSACIVNSTIRFSAIMTEFYNKGQNKMTDETRGQIFEELKFITNNLLILFHATDTAPPDADEIVEFSEEAFPPEIAMDGVLCSIRCMGAISQLADTIYDPDLEDYVVEDVEDDDVFSEVENSLCEIYAGIITLCEISDLDFDELMRYASDLPDGEQDWSLK